MRRLLAALVLALAAGARGAPPPFHTDDPGGEENFQVIYNQMANHVHDGNGSAPLGAAQLGVAFGYTPYARIIDEKALGTGGGTSVVGGPWQRTLNTISTSTIDGLTLVSSSITVPAGTYRVQWTSPFIHSYGCKTWLVTDVGGVVSLLANGRTGYSNIGDTVEVWPGGEGVFTVLSATKIALLYAVQAGQADYGLGTDSSYQPGLTEIYSTVELWKLR
jgi:hypothetical protein